MSSEPPTDRNPTYAISRYTTWTTSGPDRLIAKRGSEPVCIECDVDVMQSILSGLGAPGSLEDLAARVDINRNVLEANLQALLDSGLVTILEPPIERLPSEPFVGSIAVVGSDPLATEIVRTLELLEVDVPVRSIGAESRPDAAGGDAGRAWLEELDRVLTDLENPLLVGAPTAATLKTLLDINRCCLRLEATWLPIFFDGDFIRIGPTIVPHRTPCYGCLVEHETAERLAMTPEFPQLTALRALRETWPLPRGQASAYSAQAAADCAMEITRLLRGSPPRLTGRQRLLDVSSHRGDAEAEITFPAYSRCPACRGGARRDATRVGHDHSLPAGGRSLASRPLQHSENGLRTVRNEEARRRIVETFDRFGSTFRVVRCRYGPLARLPTYRSISTGYLDRQLPYLIPQKRHSGKGTSEEQAWLSAAYEMAERVSASFRGQKGLIVARPSEVERIAIDLDTCFGTRFLDVPGLDRIDDDPPVDWVVGSSLATGRQVLVPASLVFHSRHVFRGEFETGQSGGLAAGATVEDAILHGLLECVEHDGWAVWQANRVRCARVDPDSIDSEEIRSWLREVAGQGLEVIIRDRRTDLGVPAFRVWLVDGTRPQVFAVRGDGAHLDRGVALRRALTEAQHKLAFEDRISWRGALTEPPRVSMSRNRSIFFLSGLAPFELAGDAPEIGFDEIADCSTGEVVGDIDETVARISANVPASDVVFVDLTDPQFGIPTVRVITVGLQRTCEPLINVLPRLFDLPVRLGRRDHRLQYHELFNGRYPH